MVDYDKYKMTNEDIEIAIEDFFTQILIEARRQNNKARTLSDLSSKEPKVSLNIGQPGSGKTTLGRYIKSICSNSGKCIIELGSDKIATFHKYYNELLKLLPDECYNISRQFVRAAEKTITNQLMDNKINIVQEISLTKGEKDYKMLQEYRDHGYDVELNIIAVDKYESFLSCIERDIKLLELGHDPRPVARMNHDRMYDSFLQEIIEINKRGIASSINVYIRGTALNRPQLIYTTGDNKYANAQEAIIAERAKNRKKILADPQTYLARITRARTNINMMIRDERLRNNYLEQISQLEVEFLNELAFERSYND